METCMRLWSSMLEKMMGFSSFHDIYVLNGCSSNCTSTYIVSQKERHKGNFLPCTVKKKFFQVPSKEQLLSYLPLLPPHEFSPNLNLQPHPPRLTLRILLILLTVSISISSTWLDLLSCFHRRRSCCYRD